MLCEFEVITPCFLTALISLFFKKSNSKLVSDPRVGFLYWAGYESWSLSSNDETYQVCPLASVLNLPGLYRGRASTTGKVWV